MHHTEIQPSWAPCPSRKDAVRVLRKAVCEVPQTSLSHSLLHSLRLYYLLPLQDGVQGVQAGKYYCSGLEFEADTGRSRNHSSRER